MKKNLGFRYWFYMRVGWSTYFALIFTAINTLTVTYYLAIERVPILNSVFPTFVSYAIVVALITIPILILVGFVHYKRSHAYGSEAEITVESNPYYYRAAPGWQRDVIFPFSLKMIELLLKIHNNEKLSEKELEEISELQKKLDILIKGGSIGSPRKGYQI